MSLTLDELKHLKNHLDQLAQEVATPLIRDLHLEMAMAALADNRLDLDQESIERMVAEERRQKAARTIRRI